MRDIINIAVIAHVDAGKSTLVDALLDQSNVFEEHQKQEDLVMDNNDLEKERGITIYSKTCSIMHNGLKINIVDTPGHADFSSEVERIIKTVDTVVLLVDSSEGVMPQTRFVLQKSLELGLNPILMINKIDKQDQRAEEVVDEVFDLFVELGATDKQLEFPILYGIAKNGIAQRELDEPKENLDDLFEVILEHVQDELKPATDPLRMQVSSLDYDEYIGRLGIGRVFQGTLKANSQVMLVDDEGVQKRQKIGQIFVYEGLNRTSVEEAKVGDIVVVAGISDISIGHSLCDTETVLPLEPITVDEPTLSMNFLVNDSPFAGQVGKYVTSRNIKDRLDRELEVNVGLRVEQLESGADGFKVSGRGELHLSILLESMRREGYEIAVSKPEVIFHEVDGHLQEPVELVIIDMPEAVSGGVIQAINERKGLMQNMTPNGEYVRVEFLVPTRGLLGYRSEFINETRGEGIMVRSFYGYEDHKGDIVSRKNGVFISNATDETMGYSLMNIAERGQLYVGPAQKVYEGQIVGLHAKENDLIVNVCKNKKMTNVRSSGRDEAIKIPTARIFSLEEALEFIENDELVEITPDAIRLRKRHLTEQERKMAIKALRAALDENN
ncbi:translational GTPase TypA [Mollicutes bacterium LVI A0078]|nr:translational GTPase TypA [Mollicutes bacterium LVI A0075]WOO91283.1 translational GTPase TypA [Mollicutes bacterium LVI A0078]